MSCTRTRRKNKRIRKTKSEEYEQEEVEDVSYLLILDHMNILTMIRFSNIFLCAFLSQIQFFELVWRRQGLGMCGPER